MAHGKERNKMSEEDFVLAWILAARANGKVSWASGVQSARILAKQAREVYQMLYGEDDETDSRTED